MAGQSADPGGDRNQIRPLRSLVPSVRGKAHRDDSTRVFGSYVVLDEGTSGKWTAGFQDLLQPPSHPSRTGRANAGYARVTHRRKSALVSLATSLSRPIPDTRGCLRVQKRALPAISRSPWAKTRNESIRVGILHRSAFRESRRFTASGSIRQPQVREGKRIWKSLQINSEHRALSILMI